MHAINKLILHHFPREKCVPKFFHTDMKPAILKRFIHCHLQATSKDSYFFCKVIIYNMLLYYIGRYYDYDTGTHGYHDSIMAEQLAGQWFLKASGAPDNVVMCFYLEIISQVFIKIANI